MGRFNWWRRHSSHKFLSKRNADPRRSFFVQQLENDDFKISPYLAQMQYEMSLLIERETEINKSRLGWDAKQEKIRQLWARQMKRYNKLAEDFDRDEQQRLFQLKQSLITEFRQDVWDTALDECEGDEKELYTIYRNICLKHLMYS